MKIEFQYLLDYKLLHSPTSSACLIERGTGTNVMNEIGSLETFPSDATLSFIRPFRGVKIRMIRSIKWLKLGTAYRNSIKFYKIV